MQLPEYHPYLLDALKTEKKASTIPDRWARGGRVWCWIMGVRVHHDLLRALMTETKASTIPDM